MGGLKLRFSQPQHWLTYFDSLISKHEITSQHNNKNIPDPNNDSDDNLDHARKNVVCPDFNDKESVFFWLPKAQSRFAHQ